MATETQLNRPLKWLFFVDTDNNESCSLTIDFDYLLKIKCEDLLQIANPTTTNVNQRLINQIILDNEELAVRIENVTNQIVVLNSQLATTPYSIECPLVGINA